MEPWTHPTGLDEEWIATTVHALRMVPKKVEGRSSNALFEAGDAEGHHRLGRCMRTFLSLPAASWLSKGPSSCATPAAQWPGGAATAPSPLPAGEGSAPARSGQVSRCSARLVGLLACAALRAQLVIQSDDLQCAASLYGESITVAPGPLFGVRTRGNAPSNVAMVLCIDLPVACTELLLVPPGLLWGEGRNVLASPPQGAQQVAMASGATPTFVPIPATTALLNSPFAAQFAGLSDGKWNYGAAFDVVVTHEPVPRNTTEPARPVSERNVYGEDHVAWAPFDAGSPRQSLLLPFAPGATQPSASITLANGAPLVLSDVPFPVVAPDVLHKVEALAALVQQRWGHRGYRLRVTSAKRPTTFGSNEFSYHKYGRGVDMSLADNRGKKLTVPWSAQARDLDSLARLAVEAGFDYAFHEPDGRDVVPAAQGGGLRNQFFDNDHVHASMHTGGPTVVIESVSPGFEVPNTTRMRWTVTVTVTDPDGVWQVFAEVRQLGQALPWGPSFQPSARVSNDAVTPPPQLQRTFDVEAERSVLQNNQATLHVWARDTFGSVKIDLAQAAPRRPVAETRAVDAGPILPNMVPIAAGTFLMGSSVTPLNVPPYFNQSVAQPVHSVTITRPFWIGKYEVTQAEYQAVMGSNPSSFVGPQRPVESVMWTSAMAYCVALTVSETAAGRVPASYQYRLPTEAEWEYCYRAGTTTEYWWGQTMLCGQAHFSFNYHSNSYCGGFGQTSTANVGSYAANPWGLHDVAGNVWEWCLDSWDGSANYPPSAVTDPYVTSGPTRAFRGGSWLDSSSGCRAAVRVSGDPGVTNFYVGFRVVLAPVLVP